LVRQNPISPTAATTKPSQEMKPQAAMIEGQATALELAARLLTLKESSKPPVLFKKNNRKKYRT
jgi:hypothetical protein